MALSRIQLPPEARRGDAVEVRVLIQHPMETGFRRNLEGKRVPRNVLHSLACRYNGAEVHRELKRRGILEGAEAIPFGLTLGKIFAPRS